MSSIRKIILLKTLELWRFGEVYIVEIPITKFKEYNKFKGTPEN